MRMLMRCWQHTVVSRADWDSTLAQLDHRLTAHLGKYPEQKRADLQQDSRMVKRCHLSKSVRKRKTEAAWRHLLSSQQAPTKLHGVPFPGLWAAAWALLAPAQGAALLRQAPPRVLGAGLAGQPLLRRLGGLHLFPWAPGPCRRQVDSSELYRSVERGLTGHGCM